MKTSRAVLVATILSSTCHGFTGNLNTQRSTIAKQLARFRPVRSHETSHLFAESPDDIIFNGSTEEFVGSATPTSSGRTMNKPLHMIDNDEQRREFEMNLGKAVDTLRKDYPKMLSEIPDFSVFHEDLEVVDPSGVTLHGLANYKKSFQFVRAIVSFFYCPESSGLTFRLVYDWARNNIRVSWNVVLIPKQVYGGVKRKLHVDGISIYDINRKSGLITQHRFEHMTINDIPVQPENGIFNALTSEVVNPAGVPSGGILGVAGGPSSPGGVDTDEGAQPTFFKVSGADQTSGQGSDKNFESKNASRAKFGLKPLTRDEFNEIEAEVIFQERQQRQSFESAAELQRKKKKRNFLQKMMAIDETCTSNEDCERPEVCCDFKFKKICCASGVGVSNKVPGQLIPAVATVPADRGPPANF